ncbi:MAG: adenine phosphoribosyltransferase [Puniceicoccaceae bacterium]
MKDFKQHIRTVRGWPLPEVNFRDISTLFENGDSFAQVIEVFEAKIREFRINRIAGVDARGFILAGGLSAKTGLPMVMVRKKGKLPPTTIEASYELEYGEAAVEIRTDSCKPGDRVMILDDLIATGGTLSAASQLIQQLGGTAALIAAVIDLPELGGSAKLRSQGLEVFSLCSFTEDE